MAGGGALVAEGQAKKGWSWTATQRSKGGAQRHHIDLVLGCTLAYAAGWVPALSDLPPLFSKLDQKRGHAEDVRGFE